MAHYAEIKDGIVVRVVVVDNDKLLDGDGTESGEKGSNFCVDLLGGEWVQTSFNTRGNVHKLGGTPLRRNYAGVGYSFDSERDAFIPPKPYESWLLDEDTCWWKAPLPPPDADKNYGWNEESGEWEEFTG